MRNEVRPNHASKDVLRQVIARQTADEEFILKRTRREQVEWCRKKLKVSRAK